MALIPLEIQPGIYRNGTDFQGANRWRDASLVRWRNGSLRPIGGWSERADVSANVTVAPRKLHTWVDNDFNSNIAIGSASELLYVSSGGTATDITPTGLVTGNEDAVLNSAYGGGYYGGNSNNSLYGVSQPTSGIFQEADTWSLDNWGENLVACLTSDGKLYEWDLNIANNAVQITNSPIDCKGIFVSEERFVFAIQAGGIPRKLAWSDKEDNTTWTPSATNEAGDFELATNGEIMQMVKVRGKALIVTTTDAHLATYQGPPYVYGFERVGTSCGVASRCGVISIEAGAFWMGNDGFFAFNGSVVQNLSCDVQDYVFADINKNQITKANAVHNSEHGEIWWFYPSSGSKECDSYVAYSYREEHWTIGRMARTCGADRGVFDRPIYADNTGVIYSHERINVSHGTDTPFAETGPISIGNGDSVMKVNQIVGDEKTLGDVKLQFKTRFYPNDAERTYPSDSTYYDLTQIPTSARFTGRQVRYRIEGTNNNSFRVGTVRINGTAGGSR